MTTCPRQAGGAGQPRQQPGMQSRQHSGMQQHSTHTHLSQVGCETRLWLFLCGTAARCGRRTHVPYAHDSWQPYVVAPHLVLTCPGTTKPPAGTARKPKEQQDAKHACCVFAPQVPKRLQSRCGSKQSASPSPRPTPC